MEDGKRPSPFESITLWIGVTTLVVGIVLNVFGWSIQDRIGDIVNRLVSVEHTSEVNSLDIRGIQEEIRVLDTLHGRVP